MSRNRLGCWTLWAALALVAGCGGPAPPPPTIINATISASADANASASGAGSPVAVRIYQLVSPAAFTGAQFFPLFDKDAATLKDDLVKRDDLLLAPDQSRSLTLQPEDRAHAVGVFAAYRDYEHVDWHVVADIAAHQTSTLTVMVTKAGVTAKMQPAKPAS
jgi:type VI secretion system protein VasD